MAAPRCGAPGSGPSVAAILRRFLPEFSGPLSPHTRRVLRRLARCHTGQLGWTLWRDRLRRSFKFSVFSKEGNAL